MSCSYEISSPCIRRLPKYPAFDPEDEGLIVSIENEEPVFQLVRGKKRPSIAVTTLFGGVQLGRPYENELMDSFGLELMSFDSKLEAAQDGNERAMNEVAMTYLNGDEDEEIEPDPKKAFYWLNKLAELGDSDAMFNLGLFYAKGMGTERSFEKAADWMRKCAEAGDPDGLEPSKLYSSIVENEKKANAGDAQAMAELAAAYMRIAGSLNQAGPGKDYEESRKWAEKAADLNNGYAYWVLGLLYEHGRGVTKDLKKAVEFYEKGADLGNRESQNNLGNLLMHGEGVKQDKKRAFELFMKSAEQGYGVAMQNLGNCYQFANGTSGNMKKAVEWYEKSLEILPDEELERKVQVFKMMGESDPEWNTDYPETDEAEVSDGPVEVNDQLKEALRRQGKPYDDDAVASLSVDEVYELMASLEDNSDC